MRSWQCHYCVFRTVKKHARTVANDPSWHFELNRGCWFQSTVFYYSRMERMTGLVATAESYPSPIYRQQDSEGGSGSINQRQKPNPTFRCDGCDGGPVTYQTRRSVEILDGFLIRTVDIMTPCCWTCITWFSASSRIRRIHTESRL